VSNDHITVSKNPNYWDAANVKLDAVNFYPTEDRSTAAKRFEAGELDSNDDLPTEQLADLRAKFGDQVKTGPFLGTYYYAVKWDKPPWATSSFAAPSRWRSTATFSPRRSGGTP